jgi:transcription initiation factor TFIIIB Brf1 subunit/transcription initiation factor TFIIB
MMEDHIIEEDLWKILEQLKKEEDGHEEPCEAWMQMAAFEMEDLCELCQSKDVVIDDGQRICKSCCAIVSRVIDHGAEWRFYGSEDHRGDDPTRCGMPTNALLPKSSLGSMIATRRGESRDMRRIRLYQLWNSMPHWERSLYNVFEQLTSNTVRHNIPSKVLDDAKVLYKRASEKKISRGENKEGLIASCVYYACLMNKVPRSAKEISAMFKIDPVILTKGNARFQSLLQLNVDASGPADFIARFGSKLNMDYVDIQKCKEFASKLESIEIVSENAPTSVAASSLWYYCTKNSIDFSKKQIAEVCDVSEVTITKCCKRISNHSKILEEFLGKKQM